MDWFLCEFYARLLAPTLFWSDIKRPRTLLRKMPENLKTKITDWYNDRSRNVGKQTCMTMRMMDPVILPRSSTSAPSRHSSAWRTGSRSTVCRCRTKHKCGRHGWNTRTTQDQSISSRVLIFKWLVSKPEILICTITTGNPRNRNRFHTCNKQPAGRGVYKGCGTARFK